MTVPRPEPAPTLCIRLPFLRGPLPRDLDAAQADMPACPAAQRLWPGHRPEGGEVPAGWHRPAGYPFGMAEAAALLAAFGGLDARDLAGARDAADRARQERRARELGEMADLAAFAAAPGEEPSRGGAGAPARVAAEQAQKLLLWLWLQEERLADLAELASGCARSLSGLALRFGEEDAAEPAATAPEAALPLHPGLIPPWRVAAASAVLFVSAETVFFVEGPMREELLDSLDFAPAPHWAERLGCAPEDADRLVAAEAPLWRALGRTRPPARGVPAEVRVWITWGRP